MKTRKKEYKSIKILKAAALVLFLVLLFTPEQRNRSVIAGIAIAGITGSLLFLLLPMLPHIPVLSYLRNICPHIAKELNISLEDVIDRYCELYVGYESIRR